VNQLLEFLVRHGYSLLFCWILAEQSALPLPSGPLLIACGALVRAGRLSPGWILLCGAGACLIADSAWFVTGRRQGGRVLRFICRVALEPDSCVRKTEAAYLRYGSRSLLVSKFIPGLNAVAAPLAAMSGIGLGRFLLFDTLGALLWIFSYGSIGYIFSGQLDVVAAYAERMGLWVVAAAGGPLLAWIAWKFFQRQRFLRKLSVARITAEQLRQKLEAGEEIIVVDVRSLLESEEDSVPGALRIPLEDLDLRHADIPRDRDIILMCS
jgi:membrane protein DedA with SNARE-associated domain